MNSQSITELLCQVIVMLWKKKKKTADVHRGFSNGYDISCEYVSPSLLGQRLHTVHKI